MSFSLRIFETMSFVYPAFLYALSAIAIPIIIHLIQLRKYKKVYFSNVSFLHSIQEQQRNTNRLKHLLVLLARILTIIFLVLAFAQPYIPVNQQKVNTGKNYISIYVDNSYSMERQSKNGTLLNEAKRKAKEIALSFNVDDEFQLLGNEFSGNQQRWLNRDNFLQNLAELKIRPESRTLTQVTERQSSFLKEKTGRGAKAFVISDFQESFSKNNVSNSLDTLIDWQMVMLGSNRNDNISIDSVWFYSPMHFPGSQEILLVKITNHSEEAITSLPFEISLNSQVIGVGNVDIEAESSVIDTFIFKNKSLSWQEGIVKIKDQSLVFDNQYHFTYNIQNSRNIAIINGSEYSRFVESIFKTEPFFKIRSFDYQQIDYTYLNECELIILNEVNNFSSGLLSELDKSLRKGSVLVSFPSANTDLKVNDFNNRFSIAKNTSALKINEKIAKLNQNNTLFEDIFIHQKNARLDLPNVISYLPFEKSAQVPEVLMRLANGQSLLNKYSFNNGIIYQFAFPLRVEYSELPKHAIVVPILLKMGTIHHSSDALAYVIGQHSSISLKGQKLEEKSKKELKKGEFNIIPEFRNVDAESQIYLSDQLNEAGIYQFLVDGKEYSKIAFNANRNESDLKALKQSDLSAILMDKAKIWEPGDAALTGLIKEEAFGRRLWKICVIFALFFIALEILLIRFGDRYLKQNKTT